MQKAVNPAPSAPYFGINKKFSPTLMIIAINEELKELAKQNGIDVKVINLDFEAVKNLYGGVRCATQVYRNIAA